MTRLPPETTRAEGLVALRVRPQSQVLRASPLKPPEAEARHLHTSPTTMNCYVACPSIE